jgi:hypothetical protein
MPSSGRQRVFSLRRSGEPESDDLSKVNLSDVVMATWCVCRSRAKRSAGKTCPTSPSAALRTPDQSQTAARPARTPRTRTRRPRLRRSMIRNQVAIGVHAAFERAAQTDDGSRYFPSLQLGVLTHGGRLSASNCAMRRSTWCVVSLRPGATPSPSSAIRPMCSATAAVATATLDGSSAGAAAEGARSLTAHTARRRNSTRHSPLRAETC